MSKFGWARFFIFVLVFVSRDLELGEIPAISLSTKSYSDFNEIWYVDKCRWLMHDGLCLVFVFVFIVLGVVILSVRLSVRLSHACFVTNPKNLQAIFFIPHEREICHMTQSKVKVTGPLKFRKLHISSLSSPLFTMGAGKWPPILKLRNNI